MSHVRNFSYFFPMRAIILRELQIVGLAIVILFAVVHILSIKFYNFHGVGNIPAISKRSPF